MRRYFIEYSEGWFTCEADDVAHAIEQFENSYPGEVALRIYRGEEL